MELWEEKWDTFKRGNARVYSLEEPGEFSPRLHEYLRTISDAEQLRYDTVLKLRHLKEYFEPVGGIPEELESRLISAWSCYRWKDPILENLQTHDHEKLIEAIKRMFQDYPEQSRFRFELLSSNSEGKEKVKWISSMFFLAKDGVWEEVEKLAQYYGYSINRTGSAVVFEPIFSQTAGNYIQDDCKGYVYHFCPKGTRNEETGEIDNENIVNSITRSGLRIKNGPTEKDPETREKIPAYRYFPNRIHVLAFEVPGTKDILEQIKRRAWDMKGLAPEEIAIFKINVRHLPYTFYRDTSLGEDDHAFYTYNSIPPVLITRVY